MNTVVFYDGNVSPNTVTFRDGITEQKKPLHHRLEIEWLAVHNVLNINGKLNDCL